MFHELSRTEHSGRLYFAGEHCNETTVYRASVRGAFCSGVKAEASACSFIGAPLRLASDYYAHEWEKPTLETAV